MEKKNIKEVSIAFECPAYSGLMRISKNWISYEEMPYEKYIQPKSWSFRHSNYSVAIYSMMFFTGATIETRIKANKSQNH